MDYNQIRNYANQIYYYAREGDWQVVYPTKQYYTEGIESPSTAMLIMKDEFNKQSEKCAEEATKEYMSGNKNAIKEFFIKAANAGANQQAADIHELVVDSKQAFCTKMSELYPITGPKRVAIIDKGAVVFDYIKPKFTGLKKLSLANLAKKYIKIMG